MLSWGSRIPTLPARWALTPTRSASVGPLVLPRSVYSNRYSDVGSDGTFSNNHGYYAGGTLGYAYSERTQATLAAGYSYYSSDISHSDSMTATLGIVHQVSPQLTISVSGGGFWSDTTARTRDSCVPRRAGAVRC